MSVYFLIGFVEDLTFKVPISIRFGLIFLASIFLVIISKSKIVEADIVWFNYLLSFQTFSIFFSVVGITSTANALNFIDGLNGLAAGLGMIILGGFLYLSVLEKDSFLVILIIILIFSSLPFWLLNVFKGSVFLGDGGAYFLGAFIAWSGISLTINENEVSPWTIFLIIIYPALDLVVTFFRRIINKKSPFSADNKHLHTMLYIYALNAFPKLSRNSVNSLCGSLLMVIGIAPVLTAIKYRMILILLFVLFYYISSYMFLD